MRSIEHKFEFVVVGGGLAGICAAITAARAGIDTALVQDRPVPGGCASKEVRVPPVGADNCNFMYSRETGLAEEIMLKNLYDNPDGSPEGWDIVLKSFLKAEPKLTCFFNTSVCQLNLDSSGASIDTVKGYTAGAETWHVFNAPLFADCTGDGTVGALAGAPFRIGIEARSEFDESMCKEQAQDVCLGSSAQMKTRDAGRPMPFNKPDWVKLDLNDEDFGPYRPVCEDFFPNAGGYWWIEWGGEIDTIHETEQIFEKNQEIVLAVWDYLKNKSSMKDKLQNYELDWVSPIAGKRESRRLVGDYILSMGDIENQIQFPDAVAFGGWGFDHHPEKGFFDKVDSCTHIYHAGPYNIPLRCLYSKGVNNLFMAGRNISATHYALSSTRVMFTCAQLGEAVGIAAAKCVCTSVIPRDLLAEKTITKLQQNLMKNDHHLHDIPVIIPGDLAPSAKVTASSTLASPDVELPYRTEALDEDKMLQLPVITDKLESISLMVSVTEDTTLEIEFYQGPKNKSTFPEDQIYSGQVSVNKCDSKWISLPLGCGIKRQGWHFLVMKNNPAITLHVGKATVGCGNYFVRPEDPMRPNPSSKWHTGKAGLYADGSFDVDSYCFRLDPPQPVYNPENVINEWSRPTHVPNIWASKPTDFTKSEWIEFCWDSPQSLSRVDILFDSMLDFHFKQKWNGYSTNVLPAIVKDYRLWAEDKKGNKHLVAEVNGNYQRFCRHSCTEKNITKLRLEVLATNGLERAQIYSIRAFK